MTYKNRLTLISFLAILLFLGFPQLFSIFPSKSPASKNKDVLSLVKKRSPEKTKSPFKIESPSFDILDNEKNESSLESDFAKSIYEEKALFSLSIKNQNRIKLITEFIIKETNNLISRDSKKEISSIIPIPNFMTSENSGQRKTNKSNVKPWKDFQKIGWENISNIQAKLLPKSVKISENLTLPEFSLNINFKNEESSKKIIDFIEKYVIDAEDYILNDGLNFEKKAPDSGTYTLKQGTRSKKEFAHLDIQEKSLSLNIKGNSLENENIFNTESSNFEKRDAALRETLPYGEDGVFVDFKMLKLWRPEVIAYLKRREEADPVSTFFESIFETILSVRKGNLSKLSVTFQDENIEQGRACLSLEEKNRVNLPHWENLSTEEESSLAYPDKNSLLGVYGKSNHLKALLETFPSNDSSYSYQLDQVKNKADTLINSADSSEISLSLTSANLGMVPEVTLDISSNSYSSSELKKSTPSIIESVIPEKVAAFINIEKENRNNKAKKQKNIKSYLKEILGLKLKTKELNNKSIRIYNGKNKTNVERLGDNKGNVDFSIIANTKFITETLNSLSSDKKMSRKAKLSTLSNLLTQPLTQDSGDTYSYSHKAEILENDLVCLDITTQKFK